MCKVSLCKVLVVALLFVLPKILLANPYPDCVSADSDPDGDGYGYENSQTCLVGRGPTPTPATCFDSYPVGDGWGWNGFESCQLDKPYAYTQVVVEISATESWKQIVFDQQVSRIISITGGWTVDYRNYYKVGPHGHFGSAADLLSPYNVYKFDQRFPFGALLLSVAGADVAHVSGPMEFKNSVAALSLRINDGDSAFGDNQGKLVIVFE